MNVTVEVDSDDRQILCIYLRLKQGEVFRTVEVAEGACYADEDKDGNLLSVEMLAPGELRVHVKAVSTRYRSEPKLEEILHEAFSAVKI